MKLQIPPGNGPLGSGPHLGEVGMNHHRVDKVHQLIDVVVERTQHLDHEVACQVPAAQPERQREREPRRRDSGDAERHDQLGGEPELLQPEQHREPAQRDGDHPPADRRPAEPGARDRLVFG